MKWEIVVWASMLLLGIVGSFWNAGHLVITVLPSGCVLLAVIDDYRKEKKRKQTHL